MTAIQWLNGWTYRVRHDITGSSTAGTGYQIGFIIHKGTGTNGSPNGYDVYCQGNCNNDFSDLRFLDANQNDQLLPYWIENYVSGDYAAIWVKISESLSSGNTVTLNIYYGNASATSLSNGTNTCEFFDDFNSLNWDNWNSYGTGDTPTVSGGNLVMLHDAGYTWTRMQMEQAFGINYAMRWRSYQDSVGDYNKATGEGWGTEGTGETQDEYFCHYHNDYSHWFWVEYDAGTGSTSHNMGSADTSWHTWEIGRGNATTAYCTKDGVADHTLNTYITGGDKVPFFQVGSSGWDLYGAHTLYVAWIMIRKYVDPEPSHSTYYSVETAPTHTVRVPTGAIGIWSGYTTNIPANWKLCDGTLSTPDLRSKFVKGAPAGYEAGNTGGSNTHNHGASGTGGAEHTHALQSTGGHTHITGAAGDHNHGSGVEYSYGGGGSYDSYGENAGSHSHTTASGGAHSHTSGNTVSGWNSHAHSIGTGIDETRPPFYTILYIYADTYADIATGIICVWSGLISAIPSGFTLCNGGSSTPDLREKFIQGAPAGSNAGSTGGATSHHHDVDNAGSHNHSASDSAGDHSHTYGSDSASHNHYAVYEDGYYNVQQGDNNAFTHQHAATNTTGAHTHTLNAGGTHNHTETGSGSSLPTYKDVLFVQNTSATALAAGVIFIWTGTIATIPTLWVLCNSAPDYRGYFIRGAPAGYEAGNTGGAATHSHTATGDGGSHNHAHQTGVGNHTHNTTDSIGNHTHGWSGYGGWGSGYPIQYGFDNSAGAHSHTQSAYTWTHTHTVDNNSALHNHSVTDGSSYPAYYDVQFIIYSPSETLTTTYSIDTVLKRLADTSTYSIDVALKEKDVIVPHRLGYASTTYDDNMNIYYWLAGNKVTLLGAGYCSKITAYVETTSYHNAAYSRCLIYNADTNAFVAESEEIYLAGDTALAWVDYHFASPVSLSAGNYYILMWSSNNMILERELTDAPPTGVLEAATPFGPPNPQYDTYPDPISPDYTTEQFMACMYATITTFSYPIDVAFKKKDTTSTYSIDALIKDIKTLEYYIDLLIKASNTTKTYSIDMLIKKLAETKTYSIDTLIKKKDTTSAYSIDALIKSLNTTKTYSIDTLIKRLADTKAYSIDLLIKRLADTSTYSTDVVIKEANRILPLYGSSLWLDIEEQAGTKTYDRSNNRRIGTVSGCTWVAGRLGTNYALLHNGTSDYINASLGTYFGGNNPLTACAWVYIDASVNGPIFGVCNSPPDSGWDMPFLSCNGLTVYGWIWQVNGNVPISTTVTAGWHFLAITYDPSGDGEEILYVDGSEVNSATGQYSPSGTEDYYTTALVGSKPSGVNAFFNGKIDEVLAFDRCLTPQEILLLYNADMFSYSIDVLLKSLDTTKTYSIDTLIKRLADTKPYSIDILIKASDTTKTYLIDALIKRLADTKAYSVDVIIKALGTTKTYLIDILTKQLDATKTYSIDTLIKRLNDTTGYLIDYLSARVDTKAYSVDTLIKKLATTSEYSTDVLLKELDRLAPHGDALWWGLNEYGDNDTILDLSGNGRTGSYRPTPTDISTCESTTDWSGTDISTDSDYKVEGSNSLKDEVSNPVAGTIYITSYNPTSALNFKTGYYNYEMWFRCTRASTAFTYARMYVYDTNGNYRYYDIAFNANEWTRLRGYLAYLDLYGGQDDSSGGSATTISTCESTTDWSTDCGSVATEYANKEGVYQIQQYIGLGSMIINTEYYLRYNPSGSWNWTGKNNLVVDVGSCVSNSYYNYFRVKITDTSGNYAYWNLIGRGLTYANIRGFVLPLGTYDGNGGTDPDLSAIDRIDFIWNRSSLATNPEYHVIDWIRVDDVDTEHIDKFTTEIKAADANEFTTWRDKIRAGVGPVQDQSTYKFGNASRRCYSHGEEMIDGSTYPHLDDKSYTIAFWFKPNNPSYLNQTYTALFYKWRTNIYTTNGYIGWTSYYGDSLVKTPTLAVTWADKWYFVVCRNQKETSEGALDGWLKLDLYDESGLVGTTTTTGYGAQKLSDTIYFEMNRPYWMCFRNDFADIWFDELHIFEKYLTDEEVTALRTQNCEGYLIDTLIQRIDTLAYSIDTLIKKSDMTSQYDIDLIIKRIVESPYSIDVLLRKTNTLEYFIDVALKKIDQTADYLIDTALKTLDATKEYSVDVFLSKLNTTNDYFIDVVLKQLDATKTYNVDTLIKALDTIKQYSLDVMLVEGGTMTNYLIDAVFKAETTLGYLIDTLIKKSDVTKDYLIDLIIKKIDTKEYLLDVAFRKETTAPYLLDALFRSDNNVKEYLLEVLLKKNDTTSEYLIDALFSSVTTSPYLIDALIKLKDQTSTYWIDIVIKKLDAMNEYSLDALFSAINQTSDYATDVAIARYDDIKEYLVEVMLVTPETSEYLLDVVLKSETVQEYLVDVYIKGSEELSYLIDVIFQTPTQTQEYLIDVLLSHTDAMKDYLIDVILSRMNETGYLTDFLISMITTSEYQIDTLLKMLDVVTPYQLDTLFKRLDDTSSYDIDVRMVFALSSEYYVDTILKQLSAMKSYTIDFILMNYFTFDWVINREIIEGSTITVPDYLSQNPEIDNNVWSKKIDKMILTARLTNAQLASIMVEKGKYLDITDTLYEYRVIVDKIRVENVDSLDHPWKVEIEMYVIAYEIE